MIEKKLMAQIQSRMHISTTGFTILSNITAALGQLNRLYQYRFQLRSNGLLLSIIARKLNVESNTIKVEEAIERNIHKTIGELMIYIAAFANTHNMNFDDIIIESNKYLNNMDIQYNTKFKI